MAMPPPTTRSDATSTSATTTPASTNHHSPSPRAGAMSMVGRQWASEGTRPARSCASAASTTLAMSIARVIGPTPPGIGAR